MRKWRRLFVWTALLLLLAPNAFAQRFRAQVISRVDEGELLARGLNNAGVWAGGVRRGDGSERGYIGSSASAHVLGTLGGTNSVVLAISSDKWAVGSSLDSNGVERAFLYWDGYMEDLSFFQPPSHGPSAALGVSDSGHVTGWIRTPAGEKRAFSYYRGHFKLLPFFDASQVGLAINGVGDVLGHSVTSNGVERAFIYLSYLSHSGPRYLPTLGGKKSRAYALAGSSIVGEAETASGAMRAFDYQYFNNHMRDLGALGGTNSRARAANPYGRVVGEAETAEGQRRAFYYRKGRMHDLNTLIDQRDPLVLTSAFAINLSDAILAEGAYNGEAVQVYLTLIEPFVDEPLIESNSLRLEQRGAGLYHLFFRVNGPLGSNYVIQASDDLRAWEDSWGTQRFYEWAGAPITGTDLDRPRKFFRIKLVE